MFVTEQDFYVRREHYRDLLREAAHERLVRSVQPVPENRTGPFAAVVEALGARVTRWACRLPALSAAPACSLPAGS